MELTIEQIITELQKQNIANKYHKECIPIIMDYISKKQCSLEDAVKFVNKWVGFNELPIDNAEK